MARPGARGAVVVRDAVPGDEPALGALWSSLSGAVTAADPAADVVGTAGVGAPLAEALVHHLARADSRILLAENETGTVGAAFVRRLSLSPLDTAGTVQLSHVEVAPAADHETVTTALLDEAVSWAEESGVATVVTGCAATDRDTNRVFARLGLGQAGVLRAAGTAALRARLLTLATGSGRRSRRAGAVVAVRRTQRRLREESATL